MTIQSYKDLDVWKKSVALVTNVYSLTKAFPKDELYGLTAQIRRSAVSIPSNIAEGRAKRSTKDFMRFINIAYGSAAELETQLVISKNLEYVLGEQLDKCFEEIAEICRMLNGLLSSLERKLQPDPQILNPKS